MASMRVHVDQRDAARAPCAFASLRRDGGDRRARIAAFVTGKARDDRNSSGEIRFRERAVRLATLPIRRASHDQKVPEGTKSISTPVAVPKGGCFWRSCSWLKFGEFRDLDRFLDTRERHRALAPASFLLRREQPWPPPQPGRPVWVAGRAGATRPAMGASETGGTVFHLLQVGVDHILGFATGQAEIFAHIAKAHRAGRPSCRSSERPLRRSRRAKFLVRVAGGGARDEPGRRGGVRVWLECGQPRHGRAARQRRRPRRPGSHPQAWSRARQSGWRHRRESSDSTMSRISVHLQARAGAEVIQVRFVLAFRDSAHRESAKARELVQTRLSPAFPQAARGAAHPR